jgi:DNA-binding beta-propeller fold protein YncE
MALSPDGKTLYVPAVRAPKWYVVDAANGAVIKTIDKEGSPTTRSTRPMERTPTWRARGGSRRSSP